MNIIPQSQIQTGEHLAIVTEGKAYTDDVRKWDLMWRFDQLPNDRPQFATAFRLLPGVKEFYATNFTKSNRTGLPRNSYSGWRKAAVGLIGLDIDREHDSPAVCLDLALQDLRKVIAHLRRHGVKDESWAAFVSGKKGLSLHILPDSFGPELLRIQAGPRFTGSALKHAHERQAYLALEAISAGIVYDQGMYQTLRLLRIANSRHDMVQRYKVRIWPDELTMAPADLLQLAASPRLVDTVPSSNVDPALVALLRLKLEEMAKFEEENYPPDMPAQGSKGLQGSGEAIRVQVMDPVPTELSQSVFTRVKLELESNEFLKQAWTSIPRPDKRSNTQSDYDYRCAIELFLVGWTIDDVATALRIRPQTNIGTKHDGLWLHRTLTNAKTYADAHQIKAPKKQIMVTTAATALREGMELSRSQISFSPLWRTRTGLGSIAQRIYLLHLDCAGILGFKPDDGGWMGPYFLDRQSICGKNGVCCGRTMDTCYILLQAIGLMKKLQIGGIHGGERLSTDFKIRLFNQAEELALCMAAIAAKSKLKTPTGVKLGRAQKEKAKWAARMILAKAGHNCGKIGSFEKTEDLGSSNSFENQGSTEGEYIQCHPTAHTSNGQPEEP